MKAQKKQKNLYVFFHGGVGDFDFKVFQTYGKFLKLISSAGVVFVNTSAYLRSSLDDLNGIVRGKHNAAEDCKILKQVMQKYFGPFQKIQEKDEKEKKNVKECEHRFVKGKFIEVKKKKNYYNYSCENCKANACGVSARSIQNHFSTFKKQIKNCATPTPTPTPLAEPIKINSSKTEIKNQKAKKKDNNKLSNRVTKRTKTNLPKIEKKNQKAKEEEDYIKLSDKLLKRIKEEENLEPQQKQNLLYKQMDNRYLIGQIMA